MNSEFAGLLGQLRQTAREATAEASNVAPSPPSAADERDAGLIGSEARGGGRRSTKRRLEEEGGGGDGGGRCRGGRGQRREQSSCLRHPPEFALPPDAPDLRGAVVSFLCGGAQKGGTTWLHEMLRRHPDLSLPDQKEVRRGGRREEEEIGPSKERRRGGKDVPHLR